MLTMKYFLSSDKMHITFIFTSYEDQQSYSNVMETFGNIAGIQVISPQNNYCYIFSFEINNLHSVIDALQSVGLSYIAHYIMENYNAHQFRQQPQEERSYPPSNNLLPLFDSIQTPIIQDMDTHQIIDINNNNSPAPQIQSELVRQLGFSSQNKQQSARETMNALMRRAQESS